MLIIAIVTPTAPAMPSCLIAMTEANSKLKSPTVVVSVVEDRHAGSSHRSNDGLLGVGASLFSLLKTLKRNRIANADHEDEGGKHAA